MNGGCTVIGATLADFEDRPEKELVMTKYGARMVQVKRAEDKRAPMTYDSRVTDAIQRASMQRNPHWRGAR